MPRCGTGRSGQGTELVVCQPHAVRGGEDVRRRQSAVGMTAAVEAGQAVQRLPAGGQVALGGAGEGVIGKGAETWLAALCHQRPKSTKCTLPPTAAAEGGSLPQDKHIPNFHGISERNQQKSRRSE